MWVSGEAPRGNLNERIRISDRPPSPRRYTYNNERRHILAQIARAGRNQTHATGGSSVRHSSVEARNIIDPRAMARRWHGVVNERTALPTEGARAKSVCVRARARVREGEGQREGGR